MNDPRVPSLEQWHQAITDSPEAQRMCWEALGYARGYCDAIQRGSGDAVDFARAFSMLVASGASRPSIDGAWRRWIAGKHLTAN
ncbi:hypothetical protein ACFYTQ_35630 [Nocardia sp. NPDC004068]|uniref:hypothetical protein n=1 Tax=Nocardia sp. NPDC004068 TaxID=3364303 RepID=UPI0036B6390A